CRSKFAAKDSASGVGRSSESATHSRRPHYPGPRPLSADPGKLSYHPPGPTGRDFIRSWLAGSDEVVPALCLEIRSLQPNLSRSCFHHHFRSEEHTSELQSRENLVCRLLLE